MASLARQANSVSPSLSVHSTKTIRPGLLAFGVHFLTREIVLLDGHVCIHKSRLSGRTGEKAMGPIG
jgi:hypothetical protein